MENVVIKVGGMSCQGCVKNLTGALSGLAGVASVEVSLEAGEARVGYDPAKVSANALRTVIEDCGFDAA
ncbi:cation transporter [Zoogloea sp.]|uniref:heavy-metal-associated domain-containing protein n=1 Tax=Zoogloea sp. TaxID=49181 RepID=UPI0026382578|nr:cation transporter [Zoogloea sp.]